MKQTISTTELKKSVGEYVSSVRLRGDCYVIEQRGKEGAALVPIAVLRAYERKRHRAAAIMDAVAEASDMSEAEAMALANQEVTAVRRARRSKSAEAPRREKKTGRSRGK